MKGRAAWLAVVLRSWELSRPGMGHDVLTVGPAQLPGSISLQGLGGSYTSQSISPGGRNDSCLWKDGSMKAGPSPEQHEVGL